MSTGSQIVVLWSDRRWRKMPWFENRQKFASRADSEVRVSSNVQVLFWSRRSHFVCSWRWPAAAPLYVYNWAELDTNCASLGAIWPTGAIHRTLHQTTHHDEYLLPWIERGRILQIPICCWSAVPSASTKFTYRAVPAATVLGPAQGAQTPVPV